jgi:predicted amidophosphoribosyltransferase
MALFSWPKKKAISIELEPLLRSEPEPASLADIRFLTEYHPKRGGNNPQFDYHSARMLRLKAGAFGTARHFMELVIEAENALLSSGNATVCVVPPHRVGACTRNGIGLVAKELCKERPDVVNGRPCLYRHTEIPRQAGRGKRSQELHLKTIRVSHRHCIQGRDVLLLDDIATTGYSLCACRILLLRAGAASVTMLALAKTVSEYRAKA